MKCHELSSLLELDDVDARCDRKAVGRHLASCSRCVETWPEVMALVAARPRVRRVKAMAVAMVAVAMVAVAIVGAGAIRTADWSQTVVEHDREVPAVIARPAESSAVSHETVTFDRGQRFESRLTYSVWSAPTPKCLSARGSGT